MKPSTKVLIWMLILCVALGTAVLIVSCAPSGTERLENTTVVVRYHDREAGVVCWIYSEYYKGGISCLPISQTALEP